MAPRTKTLDEALLSGAVAKNPQRYTDRPPAVPKEPLGRAPRHLNAKEQKVWRELIAQAPAGSLGTCDTVAIEVAVRMTMMMREGKMLKTSELASYFKVLTSLGMTPADRGRIAVAPPPESDDGLSDLD